MGITPMQCRPAWGDVIKPSVRPKKNSFVSAVPAGWKNFHAHPAARKFPVSIFSYSCLSRNYFLAFSLCLLYFWCNSRLLSRSPTYNTRIALHQGAGSLNAYYERMRTDWKTLGTYAVSENLWKKIEIRPPGWDFFSSPGTAETKLFFLLA